MNLTQNTNLEGLRDILLAPIEIIRDKDGYFYHPALPLTDENVNPRKLLEAFGLQTEFVSMEDDCTDKTLLELVSDGGSCAAWEPSSPAGDGWVLLAIYDTEDGIIAWFARPEPDAILPRRDEAAVNRFAVAMKSKMASARAKGRSGWDDSSQCSAADLSRLLREHVAKGDPVDVANFAMMLHQRSERIEMEAPQSAPAVPADPIHQFIAKHAEQLDTNPHAYFELAYTRSAGWTAWLTDKPARGEPGTAEFALSRNVLARGQGDTADEACADAVAIIEARALEWLNGAEPRTILMFSRQIDAVIVPLLSPAATPILNGGEQPATSTTSHDANS